jgi:WD40 repeat protein
VTWKEIVEPMGARGAVAQLALSPDGTTVASSAHMTGALLLWDLRGRKEPVKLDNRGSHGPSSIAYSPDGKMLAYSAGELGFTMVLWGPANAKPRGTLEGSATTLSMAFTPDGRRLITGHSNGEVVLWDVDLEGWPRRACEIANRNFTRDEWNTFVGRDLPYRAVGPALSVPRD